MVAVLSSVDAPLAIDLLLLTNVDMPSTTLLLWNRFLLVKKPFCLKVL